MQMTTPAEALWVRRIGDREIRWFAPPEEIDGAPPFVSAEDIIALLLPPAAAVPNYLAAVRRYPSIGAAEIVSADGPLLIVPHEHAKAILLSGIDFASVTRFELAEYLEGAESALCVYLAPMADERRDRWLAAFWAAHAPGHKPGAA